jgi:hypothetical protein
VRSLLGAVLGVAVALAVSSVVQGCSCPGYHETPPGALFGFGSEVEPDYQIVFSADGKAVETFTRNGKAYVVTYDATR